jgi:hypothetical protein
MIADDSTPYGPGNVRAVVVAGRVVVACCCFGADVEVTDDAVEQAAATVATEMLAAEIRAADNDSRALGRP